MALLTKILDELSTSDAVIEDIWVGAFWTAVRTRKTGLSTTYRELDLQHSDRPSAVRNAGSLKGMAAGEIASYALSSNTVEASIGMATINSLIEVNLTRCREINALEILKEKGRNRTIGVVGHFPFVNQLKETADNVWVVERRPRPGDLPSTDASRVLPDCDVVCLTATSIINHSFEELMGFCQNSYVVLTGPTSPLMDVVFDYGVDVICGSCVLNDCSMLQYLSQGATFRQLRRHGVRLVAMTRE